VDGMKKKPVSVKVAKTFRKTLKRLLESRIFAWQDLKET